MALLEARHVSKRFGGDPGKKGTAGVLALDGVSCSVEEGTTLGVVGESGSGKSTLGEILGGLQKPTSGDVCYQGKNILGMSRSERRSFRREVQFIFQDPIASMNPSFTVGQVLDDPQRVLDPGSGKSQRQSRAREMLERVGLSDSLASRRPYELSGGQAQRVAIARALVAHPRMVICDECTSSLDVSVQAQILNLLRDLQEREGVSYLFISHDIGVVNYMADGMIVLEHGKLVESGAAQELVEHPHAQETRALVEGARELEL
jgi:oligopeptide transport system ATP-binding protein